MDIPTNIEQGLPKANHSFSGSAVENCAEIETSDTLIVQIVSSNANDLLPVILFTASFLFLFGLRPVNREVKHPVYSGSSKIRSAVPLFLEYRKLIIHFSH